ncbi:hypothetical protein [Streptomyces sp. S1]|uniref:hypothetical protein n=1 Tax=unclassified Streptomyces TaxID=2593676 RepID=UPI001F09E5F6|nr:hypothetical protein [Streptomyces sp. S1]
MEPTEEEAMGSCCTPDHGCSTGADGATTTVGVPVTATTGSGPGPDDTAIVVAADAATDEEDPGSTGRA